MKKIILLILTGLFSILSIKAQTVTYPYFLVKNGDTVGVVFSISQAQRIDNDYELLSLLRKAKIQSDKIDSASIVVVNDLNEKVAELKVKISTLEDIDKLKNSQILDLKSQIDLYKKDQSLSNDQSFKKDSIINNYKSEVRKLKTQRFFGFIISGSGLLVGILLILHIL